MGCEKGMDFYNKVYETEHKYVEDYTKLPYYPVFQVVKGMLTDIESPSILELGCGTGQFAKMLWDSNFKNYFGVDFSEKAIWIARTVSPQAFEIADIRKYEISNEFNTVLLMEVLEHLADDLDVIRRIPDGANVIMTLPRFDDPGHVRIFKRKEDVVDRYGSLVRFDELIGYSHWIIAKGVRVGTHDS
jgi:2-polyprenyl-3-methyl-5-hydroxy-6-metoxy-1,4-benzoquinol methylase